jgi:hypothetical protein
MTKLNQTDIMARGGYRHEIDKPQFHGTLYALVDMSGQYPVLHKLTIDDTAPEGDNEYYTKTAYNTPVKGHYIRRWNDRGDLTQVTWRGVALQWSDSPIADLYEIAGLPRPMARKIGKSVKA